MTPVRSMRSVEDSQRRRAEDKSKKTEITSEQCRDGKNETRGEGRKQYDMKGAAKSEDEKKTGGG